MMRQCFVAGRKENDVMVDDYLVKIRCACIRPAHSVCADAAMQVKARVYNCAPLATERDSPAVLVVDVAVFPLNLDI